jgi:protein-L-isoaspartate O-methyltransferase
MLEVPRSLLVPAPYKREAHIDTPIRLEEQDVNISAPHM